MCCVFSVGVEYQLTEGMLWGTYLKKKYSAFYDKPRPGRVWVALLHCDESTEALEAYLYLAASKVAGTFRGCEELHCRPAPDSRKTDWRTPTVSTSKEEWLRSQRARVLGPRRQPACVIRQPPVPLLEDERRRFGLSLPGENSLLVPIHSCDACRREWD